MSRAWSSLVHGRRVYINTGGENTYLCRGVDGRREEAEEVLRARSANGKRPSLWL